MCSPVTMPSLRGVAQLGSASVLGAESPRFKSGRPDQKNQGFQPSPISMFGSLSGFVGALAFCAPPPAGQVHPQCHMIYSSTRVNLRHISRNPRKNAVSPNPPVLVSQIPYLAQSLHYKYILKRQRGSLSIREQYRFP